MWFEKLFYPIQWDATGYILSKRTSVSILYKLIFKTLLVSPMAIS
jgi:hypothetical protein